MLHSVETFYDPVEDGLNDKEQKDLLPEERARLEEEWKEELVKVSICSRKRTVYL